MRIRLLLFLLVISVKSFAYTLNLQPEGSAGLLSSFYLKKINDERTDKSSAGNVLQNNKQEKAFFKKSLEEDFYFYLLNSYKQDTSSVPVVMDVEEFALDETGSSFGKHVATVRYRFVFFSEREGKRYKLYEVKGDPSLTMTGVIREPFERIISQAFKSSLSNFDKWLSENLDYGPLLKSVNVIIEPTDKYINSKDTIQWSPEYKLTWNDFKGKVESSPFAANSNCMFYYFARPEPSKGVLNLYVSVIACFGRNTSWVKPDSKQDSLLMHEELHFDICELYVRKLQKQLKEAVLSPVDYDEPVKKIFNDAWSEYMITQSKYDEETQHGLITNEQVRWTNEVRNQLMNN